MTDGLFTLYNPLDTIASPLTCNDTGAMSNPYALKSTQGVASASPAAPNVVTGLPPPATQPDYSASTIINVSQQCGGNACQCSGYNGGVPAGNLTSNLLLCTSNGSTPTTTRTSTYRTGAYVASAGGSCLKCYPPTNCPRFFCAAVNNYTGTGGNGASCSRMGNATNDCWSYCDHCGPDVLNFNEGPGNERGVILYQGPGCDAQNYSWMEVIPLSATWQTDKGSADAIAIIYLSNAIFAIGPNQAAMPVANYQSTLNGPSTQGAVVRWQYVNSNGSVQGPYQWGPAFNTSTNTTGSPDMQLVANFPGATTNNGSSSLYIPPHLQVRFASNNGPQNFTQWFGAEDIAGTGFTWETDGTWKATTNTLTFKGLDNSRDGAQRIFCNKTSLPIFQYDINQIHVRLRPLASMPAFVNVPYAQSSGFKPDLFLQGNTKVYHDQWKYALYAACHNDANFGPSNMSWKRNFAWNATSSTQQNAAQTGADQVMSAYCSALANANRTTQDISKLDPSCGCYQFNIPSAQGVGENCAVNILASCSTARGSYIPSTSQNRSCDSNIQVCSNLIQLNNIGILNAAGNTQLNQCQSNGAAGGTGTNTQTSGGQTTSTTTPSGTTTTPTPGTTTTTPPDDTAATKKSIQIFGRSVPIRTLVIGVVVVIAVVLFVLILLGILLGGKSSDKGGTVATPRTPDDAPIVLEAPGAVVAAKT